MTVGALYDSVAHRYDDILQTANYAGPAWLRAVLPLVGSPDAVANFGCATGTLGRIVRERFPRSTLLGFDVSERMVEIARSSGCYDHVRVHDLDERLPMLASASVQLSVALGFCEFLAEPATFLAETSRVTRPGGSLLISFQEHWPDRPSLAPRLTRSGTVQHHAHTREEVADLVERHGFEIRTIESIVGYVSGGGFACPYVMVRAVRARR